jgi:hypothetical protein
MPVSVILRLIGFFLLLSSALALGVAAMVAAALGADEAHAIPPLGAAVYLLIIAAICCPKGKF